MKNLSMGLALSLIKAAILTILVVGAIASMSSCTRVAEEKSLTNQWRARVIKTNRLVFVENTDNLPVMAGDTVTIFLNDAIDKFYISNNPVGSCDTSINDMYIDNKDTTYIRFESWNVVLDKRICK